MVTKTISVQFAKTTTETFQRNKVMVSDIDDQWSADLMDMVKFSEYNKGYKYVIVVIDVFSKYLWMRSLKDKKELQLLTHCEKYLERAEYP